MKKPPHVIEIYLQPGELWFGDRDTRIRTVLGSCVALVLWHPRRLIGGMCHYMLPARACRDEIHPDGRYADEAFDLLARAIRGAGTRPQDYEAKLFGGGRMFHYPAASGGKGAVQVHDRNVEAGRALATRHGFSLVAEHLGGHGHRQVILDLWSGHAWLKHTPLHPPLNSPLHTPLHSPLTPKTHCLLEGAAA
jgi:chemotaxis protein CheD